MSFIQSTIKCKECDHEDNIAEGTFGYGTPAKCFACGYEPPIGEQWFDVISNGWHAKGSTVAFFCTRVGCDHKDCY